MTRQPGLDGFDGENPADKFKNAYITGSGKNWKATEWEMYKVGIALRMGNRTWDSITFYHGVDRRSDNADAADYLDQLRAISAA